MDILFIQQILIAALKTGTPLLLIALGELVCEKSGVLNLGQEGMMLMGAMAGFAGAYFTGSLGLGLLIAMFAGTMMALLFAILTQTLNTNQVATGLALTIFGTGLSAFLGSQLVGNTIEGFQEITIPGLSQIPFIGPILFQHDLLIYLSFMIVGLTWWVMHRTRLGLTIRAVGENPHAANALGINVIRLRYGVIAFGGAMAGLAGAYMSLAYTPMWMENMTAGRGWIALALVVFASWRIGYLMLGAYLFGCSSIMHLVMQGLGIDISPNLLAMIPYLATVIVMVLISSDALRQKLATPMSLGKPFDPKLHS
ncbi:ABC transporter permease [Vibrio gazogenes]|uniref:Nucleoside ABC transporter membrane protein n=1 Tax=Vibrio gazogenes DSM 21264 = NBRC 103151 TaxID=1123492 RepID=A0A1M5C3M9_VIBGA|nr:ABC transporter permease [Vibrio gazogenes]USP15389.1 ABC transporter permease [Vibrio gazogenes]SHF49301.1 nucleoside ABC transporter membrane protein [Vibrio gazogenes DSM 21264] [Vibrio gazogenes DSM 21264 = NBRC 103151]SJN58917.1 beta-methylgalactoside transporter inner membrane component [Vibrio gazogenes]